jgi:hypothetical protein
MNCYLTTISLSRLYSVDDKKINEYGAVDELRIGGDVVGDNLPKFRFIKNIARYDLRGSRRTKRTTNSLN